MRGVVTMYEKKLNVCKTQGTLRERNGEKPLYTSELAQGQVPDFPWFTHISILEKKGKAINH